MPTPGSERACAWIPPPCFGFDQGRLLLWILKDEFWISGLRWILELFNRTSLDSNQTSLDFEWRPWSLDGRGELRSWICDLDPCPVILTRATQALDSGFWIRRLSAHPQSPRLDFGFWISSACSPTLKIVSWILDLGSSDSRPLHPRPSWILDLGSPPLVKYSAQGLRGLGFWTQDSRAPPGGASWICDFGFDLVCDLT